MANEDTRAWLKRNRPGHPHGLYVKRSYKPTAPSALGRRGSVAWASWDAEWRLFLFASELDRDEFTKKLPADMRKADKAEGDTTEIKG